MPPKTITILHLKKSFGSHVVFDDFSLSIPVGETTCIMAPSGAGKTTLLRILMGLEPKDGGEITGLEGLRQSVVFQEDRLCENLTVSANIRLVTKTKPCSCASKNSAEIREVREALAAAGLSGCEDQPARELSGGMRRRVSLLRALHADYDILYLDEPFQGLDAASKKMAMDYLKKKSAGKTVLLVTHDREEAKIIGAPVIIF